MNTIERATLRECAAMLFMFSSVAALGCDNSNAPSEPTTGSIRISVSTVGAAIDADPNGYTVTIDDAAAQEIGGNSSVTITSLSPGTHIVWLAGLASNCSTASANPRSVTVIAGNNATTTLSAPITFDVSCVPRIGNVNVTIVTSGTEQDPDGYFLTFGDVNVSVPTNGTRTFSDAREGNHSPRLTGVSENCFVKSVTPAVVEVRFGETSSILVNVTCGAPPPDTLSQLAFVKGTGEAAEIYLISSNGAGLLRLTNRPGLDAEPDFSPDGNRIVFRSDRDGNSEIYSMNSDGTDVTRLTNSVARDSRPAWSPDGSKIAFVSESYGNSDIYVMNIDGSNPVRLTDNARFDVDPAWSPDGKRIAFATDRGATRGISVMNADGSAVTQLTSVSPSGPEADWQPAWSPDGSTIAFSRGWFSTSLRPIMTIKTDGTDLKWVSSVPTALHVAEDPAWSQDGGQLAFGLAVCDTYYCTNGNYITVVGEDGQARALMGAGSAASNPVWRRRR